MRRKRRRATAEWRIRKERATKRRNRTLLFGALTAAMVCRAAAAVG